jgi:hypothetical protein
MDSSKTRFWQASDLGLTVATRGGALARGKTVVGYRAHEPPLTATRIMPIERLLPSTDSDDDAANNNVWNLRTKKPALGPRILKHVLLAVLTLLAVVAWKLQSVPRKPAPPAQAVAQAPVHRQPEAPAEKPQWPAAPEPPARKLSAAAEAEAVRLLIAGDDLGAARVYQDLARAHPEQRAFREAARIVALRRKD